MSSRHSHGSESSRGNSRAPSREPSRLSTSKIQPAPATPAPEEQNGKFEEKEESYQDNTEKQEYGGEEDKKETAEEESDNGSVKENGYRREDTGEGHEEEVDEEQDKGKEERDETDKESEKPEDGYEAEAEAEGDDQPEVPPSPVPEVEEQSPEDFESRSFLNNLSELSAKLQTESYQTLNEEFPVDELKNMVTAVVTTMDNFKNYTIHSQKKMEGVREQMKDIRERIHKKIAARPYDPNTSKCSLPIIFIMSSHEM